MNQEFPDIIIKDNCRVRYFVMSPYTDYTYYKGYYDAAKNQICLCSNYITDILDLKENLDRELMMAYETKIKNKDMRDNETFACSQIRACRKQYENFIHAEDEIKKNLTMTCAKYLMKVNLLFII
jgi:hypothetical protein